MREWINRTGLAWAWEQQRLWSLTANRLKRRLDRSRSTALALTLATAVLTVGAAQLSGPSPWPAPVLAAAAAVTAAVATIVQRQISTEQVSIWTRARSTSEALKSEIYSYLAGGSAYVDGDTRNRLFSERTRALVDQVADLERHTLDLSPADEPIPAVQDVDDYVALRIEHQISNYYRPKAIRYEHRVRALRRLATILGLTTVVLSAMAGLASLAPLHGLQTLSAWAPVATTAAAAVTAHIAAARYDHLVIEYLRTAAQLERLRNGRHDEPGGAAAFIDRCERVISIENQGWMARWTGVDVPEAP